MSSVADQQIPGVINTDWIIPAGSGQHSPDMLGPVIQVVRQPVAPWTFGKIGAGNRDEVQPAIHTDWPFRVVALTLYSDPAHPQYTQAIIHPAQQNYGDNTPATAQTGIRNVSTADGLQADTAYPAFGDGYGVINLHA